MFDVFPSFTGLEQNEAKLDSSSSPGITDQEKEVAANAFEAFSVIHY